MRTIKRNSSFDQIARRLGEVAHPISKQPIFQTFRDLLCFCAVLGFETGTRLKLDSKTDDFVDRRVFEKDDLSVDLLYLIALAETRDIDILRDENEDKMIEIFEQYANGGFQVLTDWLREHPEDPNGDKALLAALTSKGFLENEEKPVHKVAAEVRF
jgi:dnd system-associated protein 4